MYGTCPQVLKFMLDGIENEVRRTHKQKQWELLHNIAHRLPFRFRHLLFSKVFPAMHLNCGVNILP